MSSVDALAAKIQKLEKSLKDKSVYIPPPEEEYSQYFKQRDKLTGNTKSAKKKLKHAQTKFLQARVKQLEGLLEDKELSEDADCDSSEKNQIYDW